MLAVFAAFMGVVIFALLRLPPVPYSLAFGALAAMLPIIPGELDGIAPNR